MFQRGEQLHVDDTGPPSPPLGATSRLQVTDRKSRYPCTSIKTGINADVYFKETFAHFSAPSPAFALLLRQLKLAVQFSTFPSPVH